MAIYDEDDYLDKSASAGRMGRASTTPKPAAKPHATAAPAPAPPADLIAMLADPNQHTFIDGSYTGPGPAVLPATAAELRDLYGALLAALDLARANTQDFTSGPRTSADTRFVRDQLRAVGAAVHNLNEVAGPLVYAPKS